MHLAITAAIPYMSMETSARRFRRNCSSTILYSGEHKAKHHTYYAHLNTIHNALSHSIRPSCY